jgi:predicted acylesterase/phospholipase RssA
MDTQLLELARSDFERTLEGVPRFAANLSRSLGRWLSGQIADRRRRTETMHVALIRGCRSATPLAHQIAAMLAADRRQLQVLSDQPGQAPVAAWHQINIDGDYESQLLERLAEAVAAKHRVLVDLHWTRATPALLSQQELVCWVVEPGIEGSNQSVAKISELLPQILHAGERLQPVVLWRAGQSLPTGNRAPISLGARPLQLTYSGSEQEPHFRPHDLSRLAHRMRGIQVGLVLGGGGARGMAHIGVLEVCQREGIYFDRIVGTSAGAIIAAGYAAGFAPRKILALMQKEMTPPVAIRRLPGANQWYLLAAFRLGLCEAKFRRHLFDYTFDDLLLPLHTVSVDLVSGEPKIRSTGDVVSAILESINHPVFGRPILRNGEALVDGGVLMNVPVGVLRKHNVDFTVAVDVGKRLSRTFAGNSKNMPTAKMHRPSYIATLLRVADVQQKNLATLQGAQSDFLIAPDTARFPFDDFTQGPALLDAGRRAAEEALPRLKQALAEHFQSSPDARPMGNNNETRPQAA